MNRRFAIPALFCLLTQGCPREAPMPNLPVASVKDKTKAPDLRPDVPVSDAVDGWALKIKPSEELPQATPTPPKVLYQAEKEISGRMRTVAVVMGDIVEEADAIVNAANISLEGGGGIDGYIHAKAKIKVNGEEKDLLLDEAILYKKLQKELFGADTQFFTGSAMVMNPYGLPQKIKMVVFTAGPDLRPHGVNSAQDDKELYSAVYNSLLKASEYGAKSVSIPAISAEIFKFPINKAAELYFKGIFNFFAENPETSINDVRVIIFKPSALLQAVTNRFLTLFPSK